MTGPVRRDSVRRAVALLLGLVVALLGLAVSPAVAVDNAHITGTVTSAGGPVGVATVYVYTYDADEDLCGYVAQTTTDAAGHYDVGALPAGTYRVGVYGTGYAPQFWNSAGTCHASTGVVVAAGATVPNINAFLAPTAHLKGTITGPDGVLRIDHVQVTAYLLIPGTMRWESAGVAVSAADGTYDVQGIGAGTYRIDFDPMSQFFAQEYYHDKDLFDDADSVSVATGQTLSGLDEQVAASSHITGTVTGAGGVPLSGVGVNAYRYVPLTDRWVTTATGFTNAGGHFDIGRLSAGTYRIGYVPGADYLTEYWNDKPSVELADDVPVAAGESVDNKDAQLSATSHIKGTVTGPGGTPVANVQVSLYSLDAGSGDYVVSALAFTDGAGGYDLPGLVPGTYRLGFVDPSGALAPEFYNDKSSVATADDVTVGTAVVLTGRNAQLASAAHLRGKVTGAASAPLADVGVTVYAFDSVLQSWLGVAFASTDASGNYDVAGLPAGSYRIGFDAGTGSYVDEFYNDKLTLAAADTVVVAAGANVTGKNAALATASHVTGRVTATATGANLSGIAVTAYSFDAGQQSWNRVSDAETASDGTFDIASLPPGTYRLGYRDGGGTYVTEYWNDKATIQLATDVVVAASSTVTGRNAALATAGHVTGNVTGPAGPLAHARVTAFTFDSAASAWVPAGGDDTSSTGYYDIGALAAGTYRLGFSAAGYVTEYWNDKATVALANDVVVSGGAVVAGKDAALVPPPAPPVVNLTVPTITGTAKVGQPLTATAGTWNPADATTAYHWLAGGVDVAGATASTYTPVAADLGKAISVRVTASKSGYSSANATSAATAAVVAGTIANVTVPTITGTAKVGQLLTATAGTWNPSDATTTFQWVAGGVDVSGATASTYTPVAADLGKAISVRVTASKTGYTNANATSAATSNVVAGTIANVTVPTITGTAKVGQSLTATAGTWNPSDATTALQWVAGGIDVSGATAATYTPVAADLGKTITVRVTASKTGYTNASSTSAATAAVAAGTILNVTVPTITGTAKVGQSLTATAGTWNPSDATTAFQWVAGGVDVSGATTSTYTPVAGDVGKAITVRVIASKTGYANANATSAATAAVAAGTIMNVTVPTITGTAKVGQSLTATAGTWNPSDATTTFQWVAGGVDVSGATDLDLHPGGRRRGQGDLGAGDRLQDRLHQRELHLGRHRERGGGDDRERHGADDHRDREGRPVAHGDGRHLEPERRDHDVPVDRWWRGRLRRHHLDVHPGGRGPREGDHGAGDRRQDGIRERERDLGGHRERGGRDDRERHGPDDLRDRDRGSAVDRCAGHLEPE